MISAEELQVAGSHVEWLRSQLHERSLPAGNRTRASAACFAIAQERHHAIVVLVERRLYSAAFALLRVAFEAYLRGTWLHLSASDAAVADFLRGKEPPRLTVMLKELEKCHEFGDGILKDIKETHWNSMCGFTHTGGLHVQRWNSADAIEPAFDEHEIREVLFFAALLGSIAAIGIARIADDAALANGVLERMKGLRHGA